MQRENHQLGRTPKQRRIAFWVIALSLSLGTHIFALQALREPPSKTRDANLVPFELSFVEQPPAVPPTPVKSPEKSPERKREVAVLPAPQAKRTAAQPPSGTAAPAPEAGGAATGPVVSDVPRAGIGTTLNPSSDFVLGLPRGRPGDADESPRGSTITNEPGATPDPQAQSEYRREKLTRELNASFAQDVGNAANAVGAVPGHFRNLEGALKKSVSKTPPQRSKVPISEKVRSVASALLNPTPTDSAIAKVADSALARSIATNSVPTSNIDDQRFREQGLSMLAAIESHKERLRAPQLTTLVELTTTPSGALAGLSVIQRSGDPVFDADVVHLSEKVVRGLPDNDEKALGTSWWRSLWRFTYEPPQVKVRLVSAHRIPAP